MSKQPPTPYPEIERLLETEEFDKVNQNFTQAYEQLEKLAKGRSSGLGRSQHARKAMKAIERVMDLLRELLKYKYQMGKPGVSSHHFSPHRKK